MAILEAVRNMDWERLGFLLGVHDKEFGGVLAAWPSLPGHLRQAVVSIVAR
jgi:hypothetical protein